jgi:hypothetical protein
VTCYLRSQPIRGSLLGNSCVNTQQYWSRCLAAARAQQWKYSWKPCFLCGPPRGYITPSTEFQTVQSVRDLHLVFKIPYVYDYITKLCRGQAEVILNHENPNICAIGQGEARHRKHKRLKLGGGQVYDRSSV